MSSEGLAWNLVDVDRLDLELSRLDPTTRDPYTPEYTGRWRDGIALNWDLTLLRWGYWRNRVHAETTNPSGSVTTMGWQWEAGAHVGPWFDLFHQHHSRHVLDETPPDRFEGSSRQFPVENSYGVRIHLLTGGKP